MRTPMRDGLSINGMTSDYEATPIDEKRRAQAARRALKAGFDALPAPENNFELAEDEEEEVEEEEVVLTEEDAAERDARLKAAREEEERLELERRSMVVKRNLPRPANVNVAQVLAELNAATEEADASIAAALRLINLEMALLMKHDSLAHPLPGTTVPGGTASDYDMPTDESMLAAKAAIHGELASALSLPGATDEQLKIAISSSFDEDDAVFQTSWATEKAAMIFLPSAGGWVESAGLTPAQQHEAYSSMISTSRERMVAEATRAAKAEKKLAKQLGGYQALNAKVRSQIQETMEEIQAQQRQLQTFLMLKGMEDAAVPERLEKKREEVKRLERREADLQARYAELNDERRERTAAIEQVSLSECLRQGTGELTPPAVGGGQDGSGCSGRTGRTRGRGWGGDGQWGMRSSSTPLHMHRIVYIVQYTSCTDNKWRPKTHS